MIMLVNCSSCRTPLQLPPGATSIRCAICGAVTQIAAPREGHFSPPPPPSQQQHYPPPPSHSGWSSSPHGQVNGPPPNAHGRKRAVICGVSYRNSRHELKGCLNDAKCMKYLLVNRFHFPESSIIMLNGENLNKATRIPPILDS